MNLELDVWWRGWERFFGDCLCLGSLWEWSGRGMVLVGLTMKNELAVLVFVWAVSHCIG